MKKGAKEDMQKGRERKKEIQEERKIFFLKI